MLEIIQYATSGFWVFLGCAILLGIAMGGLSSAIAIISHLIRR